MKSTTIAAIAIAVSVLGLAPALDDGAARPVGGILNGGDALYGAAIQRSSREYAGYVYRMSYDGSGFSVIHRFSSDWPNAPLALGGDGKLYGTTQHGGTYDSGTVFAMDRDGANLQTLYSLKHSIQNPGVAWLSSGVVLAIPAAHAGGTAVAALKAGRAVILHDFGAGSWIRQLRTFGTSAYGVVDYIGGCGSELFRIDAGGYHFITGGQARRPSAACSHAHFFYASAIVRGALYAQEGSSISRIKVAKVELLYRIESPQGGPQRPSSVQFLPGLSPSSDGSLVALTVGDDQSSCGSVLSIGTNGAARVLHIFPPTACAWRDLTANLATMGEHGTMYAVEPSHLECGIQNADIPDAAKTCGRVFSIKNNSYRVLHEFQPQMASQTQPTRPAATQLNATGVARQFLLTQVRYSAQPAMTLPSPQPLALHALRSTAIITLVGGSPTTAPAPLRPEVRGPALEYHSEEIPAGAYELYSGVKDLYQRFYFPKEHEAIGRLREGQQFAATPGLAPDATFDAHGRSFGTQILTLVSADAKHATFRATDGRGVDLEIGVKSPQEVPGMLPLITDPIADSLQNRYGGKDVYVGRQFSGTCVRFDGSTFTLGVRGSLRVSRIYRVQTAATLSIDGSYSDISEFQSVNPLVVSFAVPLHVKATFASGNGATRSISPLTCAAYYALAADTFQVERIISLSPLINDNWPVTFKSAIAKGRVLPGMTYAMVAAAIGYPTEFATVEELQKLDLWKYGAPAPFSHAVFFKSGRVVKYEPPGDLP